MDDETRTEDFLEFDPPPVDKLKKIKDLVEVYSGTESAVYVLRALLDDGTYAIWPTRSVSLEPCTRTIICRDAESSFAAFHEMVQECVAYANPDARA